MGINDTTSMQLAKTKFESAAQSKADVICTACPCCYLQFERTGEALAKEPQSDSNMLALAFVQLLGLALGIDGDALGVDKVKFSELLSRSQAREGEAAPLRSVA
jgi:heterodisulfide reductase subunit B